MAYHETTGLDPQDVVNKIGNFAEAAGWVVETNNLTANVRTLVLQKSGDHIRLWNDSTSIFITGHIGYDGELTFDQQQGYAGRYAQANVGGGPYTKVFMFGGDEYVHVVIEMAGGVFRHISFGEIDKLGEWEGGTYFDATYWSLSAPATYLWQSSSSPIFDAGSGVDFVGALRCDIPQDGRSDAWALFRHNAAFRAETGLYRGESNSASTPSYLTSQMYERNDPPFSGQIALGTIRADVLRNGGALSPAGVFPDVRYVNMARYSPGQEITVGSDVWKVFPMARKGVGSGTPSNPLYGQSFSHNHAYAFKKTA